MTDKYTLERNRQRLEREQRLKESHGDLLQAIQDFRQRYEPKGTKAYCWLCKTAGQHSLGCIYPILVEPLTAAEEVAND